MQFDDKILICHTNYFSGLIKPKINHRCGKRSNFETKTGVIYKHQCQTWVTFVASSIQISFIALLSIFSSNAFWQELMTFWGMGTWVICALLCVIFWAEKSCVNDGNVVFEAGFRVLITTKAETSHSISFQKKKKHFRTM